MYCFASFIICNEQFSSDALNCSRYQFGTTCLSNAGGYKSGEISTTLDDLQCQYLTRNKDAFSMNAHTVV